MKAAKVKTRTYSGELSRPFKIDFAKHAREMKLATSDDARREIDERYYAEWCRKRDRRMNMLLDEYGIERGNPHRWWLLARELARAHTLCLDCIGEDEAYSKRGAPKKWDVTASIELVEAVRNARAMIAKEKGLKFKDVEVRTACRRILKEMPSRWPARGGGKMKPEDLQKRYNEAKKRVPPLTLSSLLKTKK